MKRLLILFILLFVHSLFRAQTIQPFKLKNKIGFADSNGHIKIEPQYEDAFPFEGDYAVVKYNGSYGIIQTNGEWVLEPTFSSIYSVSDGNLENPLHVFRISSGQESDTGWIFFAKDKLRVQDTFITCFYQHNTFIVESSPSHYLRYKSKRFKRFPARKMNAIVHDCTCGSSNFSMFLQQNDFERLEKNGKVGLRNKSNSPAKEHTVSIVLTNTMSPDKHRESVTFYHVNIPPLYDEVQLYSDNLYLVRDDKKYGIVDSANKIIVPISMDRIYQDGPINILLKDGYYGIFVPFHNTLVMPQYDRVSFLHRYNKEVVFSMKVNGYTGMMNDHSDILLEPHYASVKSVRPENVFLVGDTLGHQNLFDLNMKQFVFADKSIDSLQVFYDYIDGKLLYSVAYCITKDSFRLENLLQSKRISLPYKIQEYFPEFSDGQFLYFSLLVGLKEQLARYDLQNNIVEIIGSAYDRISDNTGELFYFDSSNYLLVYYQNFSQWALMNKHGKLFGPEN